jgi:ubiquinone/menaquinone biosynthesis C-methylase UbiE
MELIMVERSHSKKIIIKKLFDDSSSTFEKLTGRPMRRLTQLMLREFNISENPVCLDVGCGTGISTFELSKKIQNKGSIIGIDISPLMIDEAMNNALNQGFENVEFRVGDA